MAQLYISGSEIYDANDQQAEWACSPEYFPRGRYANSRVLRSISEIMSTADDDAFEVGMFALPLGFAAMAAAQACRQIPADLWLGSSACRAVAVGFDSGGFLTLPEIRR